MSWLFQSLQYNDQDSSSESEPETHRIRGGGVKGDMTAISETIGRQLRGVVNFLAPPPSTSSTDNKSQPSDSSSPLQSQQQLALLGIRNDLAEIGGSLRSGLSLLSTNKAVTEISKFTSNFLQFQQNNSDYRHDNDYDYREEQEDDCGDGDGDGDEVAGITDEVIYFVKEISTRPECWTDFPLSLPNDFEMSDAQRDHASTVEYFVPGLKALRTNLQVQMGDEQFWMIYFILLLPRLDGSDFEILSTPQIVETKNRLLHKLQNKRNAQESCKASEREEESQDKEVAEIANGTGRLGIGDEENANLWFKETKIDMDTTLHRQKKPEHEEDVSFSDLEEKPEHEEDVSFSDLEDNDDNDLSLRLSSGSGNEQKITRVVTPSESSDWDQLNEISETRVGHQTARRSISHEKDSDGESNDWLKVDHFE